MSEIIKVKCGWHSEDVAQELGTTTFTGIIQDGDGDIAYFENGKWHREDGPALHWQNRGYFWYKHGVRHREDGPAAIRFAVGSNAISYDWHYYGSMSLLFDVWCKKAKKTPEEILLLRITYGV